jgi:hypothetical protein
MHAGFAQFAAFDQDAIDNRAFLARGRLQMPVLAIGGDHSFGSTMAFVVRFAADDVREVVIANSGHWLMEEQPGPTIAAIRAFLQSGASSGALPKTRLTAAQVDATARGAGGAGTSGVSGVQTTVLSGDPNAPGPYAIEIRVPPHTRIAAHRHRDNRTATSFPANGILAMAKTPAKPQPPRLGRAASIRSLQASPTCFYRRRADRRLHHRAGPDRYQIRQPRRRSFTSLGVARGLRWFQDHCVKFSGRRSANPKPSG